MLKYHYTKNDFEKSLIKCGIKSGDVIYLHAAVGYLGRMEGTNSVEEIYESIFDSIMNILGEDGVLLLPTYSYSFCKKDEFDLDTTKTSLLGFHEYIRKSKKFGLRSNDPCYSVMAFGKYAKYYTANISNNSFDNNSVFSRVFEKNAKLVSITHPGTTFIHYAERELKVPYRFDKEFEGILKVNNQKEVKTWKIIVRYLSDNSLQHTAKNFDILAKSKGLQKYTKLGRGDITSITAKDAFNLIKETLKERPYFLTEAEEMGIKNPKIIPE